MRLSWNRAILIDSISVHTLVLESAGRAFEMIASMYSPLQRTELGLDIFGGSLNVRQMRGGTAWSMHSWGIAIDFDPVRNMMNWRSDRARLARPDAEPFWVAWESQGWVSLGRERNYDWMHIQAARL